MPLDEDQFSRRRVATMLGGGVLGGGILSAGLIAPSTAQALGQATEGPSHVMPNGPANAPSVSILIYPGMVMLDLIGPLTVFSIMQSKVELVWKDRNPVMTDCRVPVSPTHDFADAARRSDIFLIPGGTLGTVACMNDPVVMDYVRAQGEAAKWVTSVCTGSLVLAAAGLLKGYRATSLWAVADLLPLMGAQHVDERVVIDRNRITAGGVTAGIDFGLLLAGKLMDERTAKRIQLTIEYAPQPPYHAGTPRDAGPELTAETRARRVGMDSQAEAAARLAGKRLNI